MKNKSIIFLLVFFLLPSLFSYSESLHHNPWELIIYRPENNGDLNSIRCWLLLEDAETGEDVTYTKAKATYEWISIPNVVNQYKHAYYLSGGMAMHLNLKPGKYKISVYTPSDQTSFFECTNKDKWISNVFYYNTDNPAKVIFVSPTADDNGFYNGGWYIDYKAPKYFKFTISRQYIFFLFS